MGIPARLYQGGGALFSLKRRESPIPWSAAP